MAVRYLLLLVALTPIFAGQPKTTGTRYRVVHTLNGVRLDGGVSFYVVMPKPDLSRPAFKADVWQIIRELVRDQGRKISVDLFDDLNTLERKYQAARSPGTAPMRTRQQMEVDGLHLIAAFDGDLSTGLYMNTLYFFPGASTSTPRVGKWVEAMQFEPR